MSDIPLIITLPLEDKNRVRQLERKLYEYRDRINQSRRISTLHKEFILARVLEDITVNTAQLRVIMIGEFGCSFSQEEFESACEVIGHYCGIEGCEIEGGTGLPEI